MDVASASSSLAIVGPQYCAPYPLQLIFAEKAPGVKRKNLAVTDIFGNLIFRTEKAGSLFAHQRVIVDAATGYVILSAEKKVSLSFSYSITARKITFKNAFLEIKNI